MVMSLHGMINQVMEIMRQITVTKQPLIVNSGAIYTLNGAPTLYLDDNRYLNTR